MFEFEYVTKLKELMVLAYEKNKETIKVLARKIPSRALSKRLLNIEHSE